MTTATAARSSSAKMGAKALKVGAHTMHISKRGYLVGLALAALVVDAAGAADIAGAWSTDPSACKSLFAKSGNSVEFAKGAGIAGTGFIVTGDKITGQNSSCSIRRRKEDGAILHLLASCSDDVALSTMQFSVKIVSDNQIVRIFPGIEDLNTAYYRCPM
jgi:hypothetical protein